MSWIRSQDVFPVGYLLYVSTSRWNQFVSLRTEVNNPFFIPLTQLDRIRKLQRANTYDPNLKANSFRYTREIKDRSTLNSMKQSSTRNLLKKLLSFIDNCQFPQCVTYYSEEPILRPRAPMVVFVSNSFLLLVDDVFFLKLVAAAVCSIILFFKNYLYIT